MRLGASRNNFPSVTLQWTGLHRIVLVATCLHVVKEGIAVSLNIRGVGIELLSMFWVPSFTLTGKPVIISHLEGWEKALQHCCVACQALMGPKGFLSKPRMSIFSSKRNDPNNAEAVSHMSPYLHYGQIAPQRAALEAAKLRSKYKARPVLQGRLAYDICSCFSRYPQRKSLGSR